MRKSVSFFQGVQWLRRLVAIGTVGFIVLLASAVLQQDSLWAEQLATRVYELFGVLAVVISAELWLHRQQPDAQRAR